MICAFATSGETRDSQSQMLSGLTFVNPGQKACEAALVYGRTTFGQVVNFWLLAV